jgi:hypothetical protein
MELPRRRRKENNLMNLVYPLMILMKKKTIEVNQGMTIIMKMVIFKTTKLTIEQNLSQFKRISISP